MRAVESSVNKIHWTPARKLELLHEIQCKRLSLEEAARRYALSEEEINLWRAGQDSYGHIGLKVTYIHRTMRAKKKRAARRDVPPLANRILEALGKGPASVTEILARMGAPRSGVGAITKALSPLEKNGSVGRAGFGLKTNGKGKAPVLWALVEGGKK